MKFGTSRVGLAVAVASICAAMLAGCADSRAQTGATAQAGAKGMTLRQAAAGKVHIGAAFMSSALDDPRHAKLIADNFDTITPENELKPIEVHPSKDEWNFGPVDKIVAFAQAHGMRVIGHNLCWHSQSPAYLYQGDDGKPLPRAEGLKNMREHMTKVMTHYKGKIVGYDVVNEALNDGPGYLRSTPAGRSIGDDFVIQAFKIAHEIDPNVELYYNDYNIDTGEKLERGLRMIKELKAAGCRVDAVGIQAHWLLGSPSIDEIESAVKKYLALGVKVHLTELDVDPLPRANGASADVTLRQQDQDPYKNGLPPEIEHQMARRWGDIFKLVARYPGQITRVTIWGTHDGMSWLNDFPTRGRTNYATLFQRDYTPHEGYSEAVKALMAMPKSSPSVLGK